MARFDEQITHEIVAELARERTGANPLITRVLIDPHDAQYEVTINEEHITVTEEDVEQFLHDIFSKGN